MAKDKSKKEKYYIIQGKDDTRPYIYKGTKPPEFWEHGGKQTCIASEACILFGSVSKGFVKPGEVKQLIMYAKDIKQ